MTRKMRSFTHPSPVDGFTVEQATAIAREVIGELEQAESRTRGSSSIKRRASRPVKRLRVVRRKKR